MPVYLQWPALRRKPCSPHPQLRGIKYMLTSRRWPSPVARPGSEKQKQRVVLFARLVNGVYGYGE